MRSVASPNLTWRSLHWVTALACALAFSTTNGAAKHDLKDVQNRLQTLNRDLAKSEEKHGDAADQLKDTETRISVATKHLRELSDERKAVQTQLNELNSQARRLDAQAARQQAQLGRVLRSQASQGERDALQKWLSGTDPNQSARDEYFLTRLSQAKANLIRELQGIAVEKRTLAQKVAEHKAQILAIEKNEQGSREELLALQKQRQLTLTSLAGKIKAQRREIGSLKRDELRLSKLIEGLGKNSPASKKPSVGADVECRLSTADPLRRRKAVLCETPASPPSVKPKPVSPRSKITDADPGKIAGVFGQLRGKLRMPTIGQIKGRFGSTREDGGTTWKGIFIRADEGTEVRAVAAGTVVFSEWMRGFGNLLVIDHDDDFFSVYGNNQTLLATVGRQVNAGVVVSTVGSSGGIPEAGLYFELRHKGLAFDPLKWISSGAK